MQSAEYILSPEFVSSFKKVDFNEACIMWRLIHHPTSATISDIMKLVFSSTSMNVKSRYYVNMPSSTAQNTPVAQIPRDSSNLEKPTAYENIKQLLHARGVGNPHRPTAVLTETFEKLPEEIEYNIDTSATVQTDDDNVVPCPETVEEALFLVSKARQKAATHPSMSTTRIERNVDYNGFEVFSIQRKNE